jgi:hypothetical protein
MLVPSDMETRLSRDVFVASDIGRRILSRDVFVAGDIGRRILSSDVLFIDRLWTLLSD